MFFWTSGYDPGQFRYLSSAFQVHLVLLNWFHCFQFYAALVVIFFFPILLSSTLVKRKYTNEGKFEAARKGLLLFQLISFIARVIYTLHFVLGGVLFPSAVLRGKTIFKCPIKRQIKTLIYGPLVRLPVFICVPFTTTKFWKIFHLSFQGGWTKQALLEMWIAPA